MKSPDNIRYLSKKAGLVLVALTMQPVLAATYTWDGGGADNNITTAENWVGDVAPQNSSDGFIFAGNTRTTVNNDFGYGSVMQFDFDVTAGAFDFQGGGISSYGGINNASANLQTFSNSQLAVFQSQTWDAGAGGLDILTPDVLMVLAMGNINLTITGSGNTLISGAINEFFEPGNTGSLIKEGTGTLTLSGNNSYTGGTTINGGTVSVGSDANLGAAAGILVFNGGTLKTTAGFTSSRATTLNAGGGTFNTDISTTLTHDGVISGSGALTKQGEGILRLNAANTYSGGTTVSAGILQAGAANALVSNSAYTVNGGTLDLNDFDLTMSSLSGGGGTVDLGSANLTIDQSASTTYFGSVDGTGTITKQGGGSLTFGGANTFTGTTDINAGSLIVNGTLPGTTNVNDGALLRGKGTLGNVIVNSGGTLSPGYSKGDLSMDSLTLNAGSITVMEIDGLTAGTQYDQINVTNTAALDGTLEIDFGFAPTAGNTFSLINANALALNGDAQTGFATIVDNIGTNLGAALTVIPVVDGNSFGILIEQGSFAGVSGKLTDNQAAVAKSLDKVSTSGDAADLFGELNMLAAEALPEVFDSLSGVQHVHFQTLAVQQGQQLRTVLGERLSQHYGIATGASSGDAAEGNNHGWFNILAGTGEIDDTDDVAGVDYGAGGISAGIDMPLGSGLAGGMAMAYTATDADIAEGDLKVDSFQLALYGRWQYGFGYLNGEMELGYHDTNTRREAVGGSLAEAQYQASTSGITVEAGHQFLLKRHGTVAPFVALEYTAFAREEFVEENAGDANLLVESESESSLRSHVGARWQQLFDLEDGTRVGPKVGVAWVHEYLDEEPGLDAGFAAAPGSSFQVEGAELDSDRIQVEAGIDARLDEYSNFWFGYIGELAGSDSHHALSATYAITW